MNGHTQTNERWGTTVRQGVAADGITKHMVDLPVGSAASRGPRGFLDFVAGLKSPSHLDTGPMRGKVPQMAGRGDRHDEMEILASWVPFRPADYQRSLSFYRDAIGLAIAREYGSGTVFYAGQSLIELASHGAPGRIGRPVSGRAVAAGARCLRHPGRTRGPGGANRTGGPPKPRGLHELHVTDPDGVTLIFVQVPDSHPLRRDPRLTAGEHPPTS
jgi:catechol 2,3-dioxygenase-like lactoylglutathione lyase family enzyme